MKQVVIILLILFVCACGSDEMKSNHDDSGEILPTQESWNSNFKVTENGMLKAIIFSKRTRKYDDKKETLMDTLKIDFYNDEGIKTTTLTSLFGKIDDRTNDMMAKDSVVAVNTEGVILKTDELHWNHRTKKITTEKFVTITTKDEIIQGYGFESDQNLKNYEIFEPIIKAEPKKEQSDKK